MSVENYGVNYRQPLFMRLAAKSVLLIVVTISLQNIAEIT